jgi:hypothetical protein
MHIQGQALWDTSKITSRPRIQSEDALNTSNSDPQRTSNFLAPHGSACGPLKKTQLNPRQLITGFPKVLLVSFHHHPHPEGEVMKKESEREEEATTSACCS